jgi:hypothetical protein
MSLNAHLATLQDRHARLEDQIVEEMAHPNTDFSRLQIYKKQKLLLKEEIARLLSLSGAYDAA